MRKSTPEYVRREGFDIHESPEGKRWGIQRETPKWIYLEDPSGMRPGVYRLRAGGPTLTPAQFSRVAHPHVNRE
jgi:hypothetical protein